MRLDGTTLAEAVASLESLRRNQPFRFGGKWYVAIVCGKALAYRDRRRIEAYAALGGMEKLEIAIVSKPKPE